MAEKKTGAQQVNDFLGGIQNWYQGLEGKTTKFENGQFVIKDTSKDKRSASTPGGARYPGAPGRADSPNTRPGGARYQDSPLRDGGRSGPMPETAPTPGDPPLIRPSTGIDTTQNRTNYSTRSHDEEYVQKLSQWGNNEDIKKAADKGFEVGQTYRAGDPLQETPAYIRPGSEEYMNRADMKLWAESNPEAAADLQERGNRREARISAHEKRMAGIGSEYANDEGPADITTAGAPGEWKSKRLGNMIGAVQKGIMETRGGKDPRSPEATDNVRQTTQEIYDKGKRRDFERKMRGPDDGFSSGDAQAMGMTLEQAEAIAGGGSVETLIDGGEVQQSRIIDAQDSNSGLTRGQAIMESMANRPPVAARVGARGSEIPDAAVDEALESAGMQRNQAVDMVRSEEPGAHLEMGKRFTEPNLNRMNTYLDGDRRIRAQSMSTGTSDNSRMQPSSGLSEFRTQKAPLKYEQGNVHDRSDADTQATNDRISPDRFAYEVNKNIGQRMFGDEYSPARPKPQY